MWIYVFIFPVGYIPRIRIARSYANSLLNFFQNCTTAFLNRLHFTSPNKVRVQISQHLCQHLLLSFLFWTSYWVWNGFDLHFTHVQHLFLCLLAISMSSWEIHLFKSSAHLKIFVFIWVEFLIHPRCIVLWNTYFSNIFSHFIGYHLPFLMMSCDTLKFYFWSLLYICSCLCFWNF